MSKLYAVVYPAFTFGGDGLGDMPSLVITPLYRLFFERVCGYSLGHQAIFYDDIDEAKKTFSAGNCQHAIIELELNADKITRCHILYEVDRVEDIFIQADVEDKPNELRLFKNQPIFKKMPCPVFKWRYINPGDLTANAVAELNKQYSVYKMNRLLGRDLPDVEQGINIAVDSDTNIDNSLANDASAAAAAAAPVSSTSSSASSPASSPVTTTLSSLRDTSYRRQ